MQNTSQPQSGAQPQPGAAPRQRAPQPPPATPPPEFQADKIMTLGTSELIALLKNPGSTAFQKMKACQRLAVVGTEEAVPALAPMLADEQMAHYARFALEPIPGPSVDAALRDAAGKLTGVLLVGVINSIGERKDGAAVDVLAKLMVDADSEVALAAVASLGRISGPQAAKVLQDALGKTKGDMRAAVAAAGLVCAEGLLAQGMREQALDLFSVLSARDMPKSVRLAAMHSTISVETSLSRPR